MAKRNIESGNKTIMDRSGRIKGAGSPCTNRVDSARVSPVKVAGSPPRTSPGLLAGHYAGCKWTEPPSPSALPLPPQHWMQQSLSMTQSVDLSSSTLNHSMKLLPLKSDHHHHDIASQLKVLLKVQA